MPIRNAQHSPPGWRRLAGRLLATSVLAGAGCAGAAAVPSASPLTPDTLAVVRVAPAARPAGGLLGHVVYGGGYRDLWTHPVAMLALDPATFAGGLTAREVPPDGSGPCLLLKGADGREYTFYRLPRRLPRAAQAGSGLARIPDPESSAHPAAAVIAAGVLDAAGVLHAHPVIVRLADDPTLGASRAEFGGRVGILEESAVLPTGAPADSPTAIVGTDELLDSLRSSSTNRIDVHAFLAARLVDFVLGDFEAGAGAWRWVRPGDAPDAPWQPVAPDANRRLSVHGGLIRLPVSHSDRPVREASAGEALDRELLCGVDRSTWDSVVTAVRARLSPAALALAVNAMPPEMQPGSAAALIRLLASRRAALARFARAEYDRLSEAVDLRLTAGHGDALAPRVHRRFDPHETDELRVHLRGDADRVVVRGNGPGTIVLRIVSDGTGGGLADSSRAGGVRLYDCDGGVRVTGTNRVELDSKPYEAAAATSAPGAQARATSPDYGRSSAFSGWRGVDAWGGFFLGGQYNAERFGFRQPRFASRLTLRAGYSPRLGGLEFDFSRETRRANSGLSGTLRLRASNNGRVRFYGLGNETPAPVPNSGGDFRVRQSDLEFTPSLGLEVSRRVALSAGLPFRTVQEDRRASGDSVRALDLQGWGSRRQLGGELGIRYWRDQPADAQRSADPQGSQSSLVGRYYLRGAGLTGGYGTLEGSSALRAALPGRASPAAYVRAGGKKIWGPHPFDEAAMLGGHSSLPGIPDEQYAGDAAVFVECEESVRVGRVVSPVRGEFGLLGLEDTGRVYVRGQESRRWHSAAGPGIWFTPGATRQRLVLSFVGNGHRVETYFRGGLGF